MGNSRDHLQKQANANLTKMSTSLKYEVFAIKGPITNHLRDFTLEKHKMVQKLLLEEDKNLGDNNFVFDNFIP